MVNRAIADVGRYRGLGRRKCATAHRFACLPGSADIRFMCPSAAAMESQLALPGIAAVPTGADYAARSSECPACSPQGAGLKPAPTISAAYCKPWRRIRYTDRHRVEAA
jgi:hypothetical protein